jgi:regulator of replication initiation timing
MRDNFEHRMKNAFGFGIDDWEDVDAGQEQIHPSGVEGNLEDRLHSLMDCMTSVGAEVSRLRAEMDGLLEDNRELKSRVSKLQAVIEEKNMLNIDEFDLACDVIHAEMNNEAAYEATSKGNEKDVLH